MQIGSIPPTYFGSFLHTLIFPHRGGPQQAERPHRQRRNRCKLLLPGQIGGLRPRRIIARLVTAIVPRFAFETLQHDRDVETFGFGAEGAWLARQGFAEGCDLYGLPAYGRCLRPALYSSLRSSPSHPAGVSALRVTIAIASARFASKQGASQVNRQSRGGSFAMNRPPADVRAGAIG